MRDKEDEGASEHACIIESSEGESDCQLGGLWQPLAKLIFISRG